MAAAILFFIFYFLKALSFIHRLAHPLQIPYARFDLTTSWYHLSYRIEDKISTMVGILSYISSFKFWTSSCICFSFNVLIYYWFSTTLYFF